MNPQHAQSLRARLEALAADLGVSWSEVVIAASQHPLNRGPGKVTDDEKPLPIGTVLNLRRELPGGKREADDKGWRVAGYLQNSSGRWTGYDLRRGPWDLQTNTCGKAEAVDVVEQATKVT